jgi:hypothetical protein
MPRPLEPKLSELLIRLVELDGDSYETFVPHVSGESNPEAELIGHDNVLIPPGLTRELARRGFLDMEPGTSKIGKFVISEEGRTLAARLEKESQGTVDLSWPAVLPVLIEIDTVWRNEGAPTGGLNGMTIADKLDISPNQLSPVLSALEADDWLEYRELMGPPLPQGIKPSPKAISFVNGWPRGDGTDFGREVLARLDERIEAEPDPKKRSKLQATLVQGGAGFRELLVEVAAAVASRQMGV